MKKFLVLVIVMLFGITKVNALTVVMEKDEEVISWTFSLHKVSKYYSYLLSPFDEYEIDYDNADRISNLAYLGNSYTSTYYQATIQVLILQTMYPDYDVYLLNGSTVFDYSSYASVLEEALVGISFTCDCDGKYYEENYGDMFTIRGDCGSFSTYEVVGAKAFSSYGTYKTLYAFEELGLHEVYFHAIVSKSGNYVYSASAKGAPFTIYIDVVGNTLTFNVDDYSEYLFNLNDGDGTSLGSITVDKDNNTYIYKKGIDLYLTDITESEIYESLGTIEIIELEDTDYYELTLTNTLKPVSVTINTYSISYPDNELLEGLENDLTVLLGDEVISTCSGECILDLTPDETYTIIDNVTGKETNVTITEDTTINISRYVISGLLLSREIESISLEGTLSNNIYYMSEVLLPDTYNITIDNTEYTLDLTNVDNYVYTDKGVLYYVKLLEVEEVDEPLEYIDVSKDIEREELVEEINETETEDIEQEDTKFDEISTEQENKVIDEETEIQEEIATEQSITVDTEIEIDIPNTGIEQNTLTYYTKKYYFW